MAQISLSEFADKLNQTIPLIIKEFSRHETSDIFESKITLPQILVLNFLDLQGETRMKDLALYMNVTTAAMTGVVDRLVRDKCLVRVYDPNDRRVVKVKITDKGKELLKKMNDHKKKAIVKVFDKIPEKDREEYLRILINIKDILVNESH